MFLKAQKDVLVVLCGKSSPGHPLAAPSWPLLLPCCFSAPSLQPGKDTYIQQPGRQVMQHFLDLHKTETSLLSQSAQKTSSITELLCKNKFSLTTDPDLLGFFGKQLKKTGLWLDFWGPGPSSQGTSEHSQTVTTSLPGGEKHWVQQSGRDSGGSQFPYEIVLT